MIIVIVIVAVVIIVITTSVDLDIFTVIEPCRCYYDNKCLCRHHCHGYIVYAVLVNVIDFSRLLFCSRLNCILNQVANLVLFRIGGGGEGGV